MLPEKAKSVCSKRRMLISGIICLLALLIIVIIIVIVVTRKKEQTPQEQKIEENKYLSNVLPSSFYAELEIYNRDMDKWIKVDNQKYHIEWDTEAEDFRYLKTMSESILDANETQNDNQESMNINITIINKEAVSSLLYNGSLMTLCHNDVYGDGFFFIMSMASNATQKTGVSSECEGRLWSIPNCNDEIMICEKDSKLIWVIQGGMRADTIKWDLRKPSMIVLPDHNGTCSMDYPEQYEEGNCTHTNFTESASRSKRSSSDKECLFVHGVGEMHASATFDAVNTYPDYWGSIERETAQCRSHRFIRMDTVNLGWDANILHEHFCNFAGGINKTIRNKLIFSHSMGNLIIAAALYKRICTLDNVSSKWYNIQAPWTGSKAADVLSDICSGKLKVGGLFFAPVVRKLLISHNFCTRSGTSTPGYNTLKTGYISNFNISYANLKATAAKEADGAMCGESPGGLWKNFLWSTALKALQLIIQDDRANDGLVSKEKCEINDNFKERFHEKFYRTRANHLEGTCRYGDVGWAPPGWKMDRPCQWYRQRE